MLVEGKMYNFTSQRFLHFFINSSAVNAQIEDSTFSEEHFDIVSGILKFVVPRVAP